jgi:hypothetical protein
MPHISILFKDFFPLLRRRKKSFWFDKNWNLMTQQRQEEKTGQCIRGPTAAEECACVRYAF